MDGKPIYFAYECFLSTLCKWLNKNLKKECSNGFVTKKVLGKAFSHSFSLSDSSSFGTVTAETYWSYFWSSNKSGSAFILPRLTSWSWFHRVSIKSETWMKS